MLAAMPTIASAQATEPLTIYEGEGWKVFLSNGYCMAGKGDDDDMNFAIAIGNDSQIQLVAYQIGDGWDQYEGFGMLGFYRNEIGPITITGTTDIGHTNRQIPRATFHLNPKDNVRFLDAIVMADTITITAGPAVVARIPLGDKNKPLDALFACEMNRVRN